MGPQSRVGLIFILDGLSNLFALIITGIGTLLLIQSSMEVSRYAVTAVVAGVGLLTIYSMLKIWLTAFWRPLPSKTTRQTVGALSPWKVAPVCALALVTVLIGLGAEQVYRLAAVAAGELLSPEGYVKAVLKGGLP